MALILDTGPLYASLDRSDSYHSACFTLLRDCPEPLVVPAPVLVEVDYLVRRRLHGAVLAAFLDDVAEGGFAVESLTTRDYRRIRELCGRYEDMDLGLVDASVIAIAERLDEPKIATLDRRHFGAVRPRHVDALRLLPE